MRAKAEWLSYSTNVITRLRHDNEWKEHDKYLQEGNIKRAEETREKIERRPKIADSITYESLYNDPFELRKIQETFDDLEKRGMNVQKIFKWISNEELSMLVESYQNHNTKTYLQLIESIKKRQTEP